MYRLIKDDVSSYLYTKIGKMKSDVLTNFSASTTLSASTKSLLHSTPISRGNRLAAEKYSQIKINSTVGPHVLLYQIFY